MERILAILIIYLACPCGHYAQEQLPLNIDLSAEIVEPRHYIITHREGAINIDGKAEEKAWQQATFSTAFIDIEGVLIPKYETRIKLLWDEDFLYLFAQLEEPHIWGDLKQRDTVIFYNNDFEVFVAPSATTYNYGEIEINALGTVWDLYLDRPYRDQGKPNNHWNLDRLQSAIHIEGTLNNPQDIDSFWTVEMAIPMEALIELKNSPKGLPKEGEQWRMNFSRVEWDFDLVNGRYQRKRKENGQFQREYNWVWSNQKVINMHEPEKWGSVQFTYATSSESVSFVEEEYGVIRQVAYALFRQTRRGRLKSLLEEEVGTIRKLRVRYSANEMLDVQFFKTHFGFEYRIDLPNSGGSFLINDAGIFKSIP